MIFDATFVLFKATVKYDHTVYTQITTIVGDTYGICPHLSIFFICMNLVLSVGAFMNIKTLKVLIFV